jgi:hypothetical protein
MKSHSKSEIAILAGLLYWITTYIIVLIPTPDGAAKLISAIVIFAVIPLVLGILLITSLKELHSCSAILYCVGALVVFNLIDILRDFILLPKEYSAVQFAVERFQDVGLHSLLLCILGGFVGLWGNRRRIMCEDQIPNSSNG